jgi:hypothetical protein
MNYYYHQERRFEPQVFTGKRSSTIYYYIRDKPTNKHKTNYSLLYKEMKKFLLPTKGEVLSVIWLTYRSLLGNYKRNR